MPTYEKTEWENEVPQSTPVKFKITDDTEGVLANSAKIELVTPVTPGTPLDATRMNKIEQGILDAGNAVDALAAAIDAGPPRARVFRTTAQTIAHDTPTALSFSASRFVEGVTFSLGQPTRLTIATDGLYMLVAAVRWAQNDAGIRQVALQVNGTAQIAVARTVAPVGTYGVHDVSTLWPLEAGDYVEVFVFQTSGGNLDISPFSAPHAIAPEFTAALMR